MTAVADFVWQRLQEWGVRRVFGYPGDGIGGLFGALARTKGAIDIVQVRHEETAKFTGEVGGLPCHLRARRHPSS